MFTEMIYQSHFLSILAAIRSYQKKFLLREPRKIYNVEFPQCLSRDINEMRCFLIRLGQLYALALKILILTISIYPW